MKRAVFDYEALVLSKSAACRTSGGLSRLSDILPAIVEGYHADGDEESELLRSASVAAGFDAHVPAVMVAAGAVC